MSGKKKAEKAAASATTSANNASAQASNQANAQTNAALAEADAATAQTGGDVGSPKVDPNAVRGPGDRSLQFENFGSDYKPAFPYLGNQLILNSDRVLLNSKNDSVLLFGKKAIGLSSNGTLNFDSRLKYIVNSPRIELGLGDTGSVALGEPLIDYLDKLTTGINDLAIELAKLFNTGNDSPFQGVNIQANRLVNKIKELNTVKGDLKSNVVFVGKNIVTTVEPTVTEQVQEPSQPPPGNSEGDYTSKEDQQNEMDQQDRRGKADRFIPAKNVGVGADDSEGPPTYSPGSRDTIDRNTGRPQTQSTGEQQQTIRPTPEESTTNAPQPSPSRRAGEDVPPSPKPTVEENKPETFSSKRPNPTLDEGL